MNLDGMTKEAADRAREICEFWKIPAIVSPFNEYYEKEAAIIRELEKERVRWEQHGFKLTDEHIREAREYAYSTELSNTVTFFGALQFFFDRKNAIETVSSKKIVGLLVAGSLCLGCGAQIQKGLDECQSCGERR